MKIKTIDKSRHISLRYLEKGSFWSDYKFSGYIQKFEKSKYTQKFVAKGLSSQPYYSQQTGDCENKNTELSFWVWRESYKSNHISNLYWGKMQNSVKRLQSFLGGNCQTQVNFKITDLLANMFFISKNSWCTNEKPTEYKVGWLIERKYSLAYSVTKMHDHLLWVLKHIFETAAWWWASPKMLSWHRIKL